MSVKKLNTEDLALLRRLAEVTAKARFQPLKSFDGLSPEASQEALYELCVYQIELEMQIEELHRTQEKLDIARNSYFELYESAPVGYCTLDERGLITQVNRTASTMLGRPQVTFINQPFTQFIDREDQDAYYLFKKNTLSDSLEKTCELRMRRGDDSVTLVLLSVTVTPCETGTRIDRITMTDISKLKQTERQLLHSTKFATLGVLSARLVQDINQPLGIISASTENLAQLAHDPQGLEVRAKVLRNAVGKIEKVVSRLSKFSNEPASRERIRYSLSKIRTQISLSDLVKTAAGLTEIKARQDRVFVTCSFENDVFIEGDEFEIEQVVTALLTNAIDAAKAEEEKWVKVEVLTVDQTVLLRVTDSGPAISDNVKAQLFRPLFATRAENEGLGINLSIAKVTLEEHGATVSVLSGAPNTCFEVIFPKMK